MGFSLDDYIHKKGSVDNQENRNVWSKETGGFSLDRYIEGKRSPAPDLNSWFQDTTSALDSISKQAEAWKNTYKSPSEIDTSVGQYTQNINDLIRRGLRLNTQFSENRSVYDANYGDGTSTSAIEDINTAIGMLEKTRQSLSQERDFRNSLGGEKEFQDYLIASGDEAAAESVMSGLEKSKAENEQKLAELRAQLDKTGDKWYTKSLGSLLSERKPIQDQIKELEKQQKSIQDQYSRYYYTIDNRKKQAAIKEDPDANALYESADVLRSDIDKVNAIADEVLFNKGNPKVPEYKQYLNEKYGLTEEAIKNFDIGGGGFKYSENGYGNLWQLYEDLENQLNATKGQLSESGYDYDRMTGYEQILADAEEYRKEQEEWEKYADEHPIASSISSVVMSPFQGLDYIRLGINNIGHNDVNDPENYVPLNVYDMDATNFVSTIRSTVSKNIEESTDWNLFGQNVASFLYQTGMSVADSAAQVAAFGNASVFLMGASAASNQAKNVIERGGSNSQAFWGGLAAGAAEALFEKISVDRLLKPKSITGWKSLLKETVKQAGVEASEEMLTEIANILSDTAIMGESSDFSMAVQAYQEQGLSETEAKKQAFLDCIGQVAWAGAGGALSGGVMGGAAGSLSIANRNVDTRSVGNQILRSGEIDLTIDEGLKLDSSDPLYKLAEELAERQNQGKTLSPKKVGQLEIGLETKALEQIESLRNQMAQGLDGDAQNGAETAPLGTVYTKPEAVQSRPSGVQYGNPANAASDTNAPVSFNVEAATPMDAQARMGDTDVTVQGVASVRDGDVTVTLSDGTNVPLYDVEIADPQIRQLYDTASKYDTNTARAFVSGFDGSLPISTYQTAFDYFMTQAKHGVPMGEAIQYAGLAGQMMSPVSVQTAYFAGENLQSSVARGNMGAENGTMGGMKNVSVRQDTGSVLGRRRFQSDNGRIRGKNEEAGRRGNEGPGVRETTGRRQGTVQEGTRKNQGGIENRALNKAVHRELRMSASGESPETVSFDEIDTKSYTERQKKSADAGKKYGFEVHYVQRGALINFESGAMAMDYEAFVVPGTNIIFASHDTKYDFIYHELFHQFVERNSHHEKELVKMAKALTRFDSSKYVWYRERTEFYYPKYKNNVAAIRRLAMEEITCDLCEYAMSGSEKMYNRLNGLFEGDSLETLAEQARGVFEANREAVQKNAAAETGSETRYYLEGYTDHQKENWAGSKSVVVYESDAQLEQFIDDALNKRNLDKKMYFGRVPSDLAQRVMDETGMDIDGYNCTIQAQEIRKILVHSHGNEAFERARGQRAITKEDIMNIPEVISSPDSISLSRKLYEGKPVIRFSKTINGRTTVVSYVSRKHRDLAVQTMYTSTKKGSLATATDAPASGPLSLTPETTGGTASNNSIGENPGTVNTSIPKRSKRDTESRYYLDEEHDSEGRRITKEQADFFKDSKVRLDDDGEYWYGEGNLMPVYHATSDDFTVFDRGKLGENTDSNANDEYLAATAHVGFWFNSQEDMGVKMGVSRVEKVYLNITRPYEAGTVEGLASEIAGTEGDTPYEKGENFADWLSWNGYDGVMVRDEEFGGLSFVALRPDQIKRVDNNTPTSDPDIRFYMDDAVEEVKGVTAYHGITAEDLDGAVQSGLPPIHKNGTGDISLIFRPEASLSYDTETPARDTDFGSRLSSIAERMAGRRTADMMEASRALLDVLSRSRTKEDIRKSLESLGKFAVTDDLVADIFSLSGEMANSSGVEYRETAGLEDVDAAIIPDTLDGNLKNQLEAAGIKTVEYKADDNADRVRALNEAPELRFFLEDVSPVDVDLLTEENQTLREQVNTLREEFKLTKGHKAKPGSLEKLADSILKETRSSYDKGTLVKNLEALLDYIANDPDSNFDEAMDVSVDIANSVLRESSDLDSSLYDHYKDMREYFRKTAISLPQDIRSGMDYERFRKEHFGGIRLTNDGASLDSLWPEISGKWPEFFSPDTPIQEQPQAVADALRTVKPSYVNPYGMDSTEAAYDLAMRMYEEYFNIPEIHTFADKKKAELNQLRAKYENRIHAIRKGYEAREQALIQEQRQKRKDLKDENRLRLAAQMEKVREQRKAASAKRQESALVRRYKPRIIRDTMELGRWLTHPTDKKHVPEPFRKAVAEFVNTIDFSSNRLNSKGKPTMRTMAMQKLSNQMNTIPKSESGTFEEAKAIFEGADPDLIPNMADLIQNAERVRIEDMTGAQLGELAHVVSALKSMLTNANNLIAGEQTRQAETVAQGIHLDLAGHKNAREYTWPIGFGKRLMSYDMMDAPSYFEELGDTAYNELYRPLRRAFDRKIRNTAEAVAYMQRLLKGVDTDTWSGPKAKKHTFKVKGGTVSLNTAQIMSLYELSKRDQARGHILGGGIRPSDTVKGTRVDKAFRPVTMTAQDLAEIVGTLTPEQRMVADGIADFFKTTAEWGNEVSMKLYGYRKFTEPNYFPIVSDKNYTTTMQGDPKHQDAILKNLGMTKSTVIGANNPIMVEDIFDVFTRQADQMGSYNAFVVPLADMNKVINFKASDPGGEVRGSVKESIERALGHDAISYWNKLVEDINGVSKQTPPTIGDKLLSNMKAAAVGANLRVIIQQPTAYLRAAALIDPKYLAKGLAAKSDIDEMNQYAPIAYWKDLGFFEMDTARGMKDILMNRNGLRDIAMKPASWADSKTWGKLWNAVKAEIQDTTDLNPGSVEFLEAAGERFSEIIDRTQVVDSVLHRSQMMRSEKFIDKTVTSFMSEPTKSYNMLRSAVRDVQKNGWKRAGKRLVRVAVTHTVTSIATALAAALIDAMRDDDKEKSWAEKYLSAAGENTLDNLSPLNMLPYLRDAASLFSGYSLTRQEMAGLTDVVNAGRNWVSYFQGDSKYSIAWLIKNSAASISKLTGIPVAAATREFEALIHGGIQALDKIGVPTTRMEYILDTFYYPVIPKNASRYAQYVYDAYKEDNTNLAQDVMGAMNEGGIDDDKIGYYMRKILREQDERIAEAGKAKMDGNMSEYAEIVREISREGFSQDWIVGAVDGWISSQKNAEKEVSAPSEKVESESKFEASLFENSDVVTSLEAGNLSEAKTVIQDLLSNGKEESSIRSSITRHYKPVYQDLYRKKDEAGMRRIREMLVDLGIGYKSGDFTRWIQDMN